MKCARISIVILLFLCTGLFLLALICTAVGSGATCIDSNGNTENVQGLDLDISKWNEKRDSLKGQYFVFFMELKLLLITLGLALSRAICHQRKKIRDLILLGASMILTLICACLESWYAAGADLLDGPEGGQTALGVTCVINSWAAAAAFLFMALILLIIDTCLVASSETHHHATTQQITQVVYMAPPQPYVQPPSSPPEPFFAAPPPYTN